MKICIAGLGLIGGSMSLALKRAGLCADGYDPSLNVVEYALANAVVDGVAEDLSVYDVVFVAAPPHAVVEFILNTPFKQGAIVCDVCGVKRFVEEAVYASRKDIRYIGAHPMAGKECSGIENACADLFDNASMVITHGERTEEEALNVVKSLTKSMGFARIVECTAEVHDRKIAYTSQLAHVVSNSYVNDEEISACLGFTGGSFQDMTRIAGVDEKVWASLYLKNADNLKTVCGRLINSLTGFCTALNGAKESGNADILTDFLKVGAEAYRAGKADEFYGDGITVTELKGKVVQ